MAALPEDVRSRQDRQWRAAQERFSATAADREANRARREATGVAVHDSLEQLEPRARRLIEMKEVPFEALVQVAVSDVRDRKLALERIIGAKDLQSWSFLPRGARAAATVARITMLDNGRHLPLGTGFLVSPRLLMTNNHVLPDAAAAREVVVEFGAEVDVDNVPCTPQPYVLDPDQLFLTDEHLDVTVVLVRPDADGAPAGDRFGWNRCLRHQGKIVTGEPVNVVGHPAGRAKEIAIRGNRLELQLDDFLHYAADTEPGNSGSPVFNDQWELVAVHHAGVPKTDEQGRYLRKDGSQWDPSDGEEALCWVANEGARISRVLAWLARADVDPTQRELLAEMGVDDERPARDTAVGSAPDQARPGTTATPRTSDADRAPAAMPSQREADVPPGRPVPQEAIGIPGRSDRVHLVFLHGRSQQGKDPARLRGQWTAGLNAGLTLAGLPGVTAETAWFPFYGDRLVETLNAREAIASATAVDVAESLAPAAPSAHDVYAELLAEAAARAGLPDDAELAAPATEEGLGGLGGGLVGRLQKQLSWLAGRSGLDDALIALLFRDVAAYLDPDRPHVREAVLHEVRKTLPDTGQVVLVAHSLGTVVALDLISQLPAEVELPLLVTAGSPLGLDAVHERLLTGGPRRPERVGTWLNAWCAADPVAIGCPLQRSWGSGVAEVLTDNDKERAHDIVEYLGDARVAGRIGNALAPQPVPAV